ncbi:hypothetical protein PR202_ga14734 [Eleusine coracana subsp. coracana]|uniref:UBC core domain-containing protein n=1 Tax=Eleusine coracana subsp. coracana TaxID=191504 RepID=A0AAV5CHB0_ELECO|nr:hypothetical protein PR202_ga14734 [Eleusine coracana subsp. coracana]
MATNENLPPNVIRQLAKELKNLDESPPEGIKVTVMMMTSQLFLLILRVLVRQARPRNHHLAGTPYENGVFRMKLLLSCDFPQSPPKGFFLTKIFHPNIASSGEICVNTLKKDWNPNLGLRHVLLVSLKLSAKLYTGIHALKPKNKSKSGAISESTTALNVDQSNTVLSENMHLASGALPTSSATKALSTNSQDQNAALSDPVVGASVAPKRHAGTIAVDKKRMDARKKSLKRL